MKYYKNDVFIFFNFDKEILDNQGWKIHIFSTIENSENILQECKKIAHKFSVSFKFIHNKSILEHFMCKEIDYKFAGKYITLYLNNNQEKFKIVIEKLYEKLHKYKPFKIFGDKNYKNSIINYRYGNYNSNRDYIISIDGKKIKDDRKDYIPKNSGIQDPLLVDTIEDNSEISPEIIINKKYKILKTLLFSNLGGVFLSLNKKNEKKYVLKEYRFSNQSEHSDRSNEIRFSLFKPPFFVERFSINNSEFFVFEYIKGDTLDKLKDSTLNKKIKIIKKLCFLVFEFHRQNIIMNDIKLENFVWNGKDIYFIDKEFCYYYGEKGLEIKNKFLESNCIKNLNPFYIDKLKLAETILQLFNIRNEVFFVEENLKKYLNYIKIIFSIDKIPKNIFNIVKKLVLNKEKNFPLFQERKLTFFDNTEKTPLLHLDFFKNKLKKKVAFDYVLEGMEDNNDLYVFLFEKIINKNILFDLLNKWKNSNLDENKFEDNLKLILLWKYEKLHIDVEQKVFKIIEKFVIKNRNIFYVINDGFLIPYIKNGIGVLCLILVEILETEREKDNINIRKWLKKFYKSFELFPNWVVKTTFLFGSSGIAFLIYYIGSFLKIKNYKEKSKNILLNLVYMQKKMKWQTQENKQLDESFFNGNKGIKWVLKYILEKNELLIGDIYENKI